MGGGRRCVLAHTHTHTHTQRSAAQNAGGAVFPVVVAVPTTPPSFAVAWDGSKPDDS